jgi:beta-lactamase regulating signal transducer with metallopeptidase domain
MESLLFVGLTNALCAAGLVLIVAGLTVLCRRRPALVHGLWILVLLKFLVPSFYPIEIPGWYASPPPAASRAPVDIQKNSDPLIRAETAPSAFEEPSPDAFPIDNPPSDVIDSPPVEDLHPPSPAPATISESVAWDLSWKHAVGVVWLVGSLTWSVVAGIRIIQFRRILRLAQSADQEVQDRVQELARRLGLSNCPTVTFVAAPIAPMLWALGRSPRLLIPSHLWERLTEDQRDTLLVHELAHLRRGDHWVRRLELLVLAIYWWHPGVWWARRALREAEEECCDAWVVWALPRAGHSYAVALVETLEFLSHSRPLLPLGASGVEPMRFLKRRLAMIVRAQTPRAMSRWTVLAVVGIGAILLPLLPIPAQQLKSDQGDDESSPSASGQAQASGEAQQPTDGAGQPFRLEQTGLSPVQRYRTEEIGVASAQADRSEQIEAARDQVELTQAKLMIKRAEVEEMNLRIRQAQRNLTRLEELYKRGVLEESALNKARNEAELLPTQLPIKKAELAEAEVLLKQATRRLQRLEAGSEGAANNTGGTMPPGLGTGPASSMGMPGGMTSRSRPGAGSMGSSMSGPGGSPGMRPGMSGVGPTTGAPAMPGGAMGGKGMMGAPGMPGASSAPGMLGGMGMPGAAAPRGGMMGGGGPPLPQATHNKVYKEVQGMILDADSKTGLATISLGTDSGLKSGHKLEVYRLEPNPKYLGKIEIVEVQAHRAVGRLVDVAPSEVLEKGALVAGKLTDNAGGKAAGEALTATWANPLIEEKSWDFGTVRRGEQVMHRFRLTNTLKEPIHISSVRTEASFVKAFTIGFLDEMGATQRLQTPWIAPHQSVGIDVDIDTRRFTGDKTTTVYVQFDQPAAAEVRLQVQARSLESPASPSVRGEPQESKERMMLLERRVQQLMKEIDDLRGEVKQQPGKLPSGAPPKGRPDGSDPAKH